MIARFLFRLAEGKRIYSQETEELSGDTESGGKISAAKMLLEILESKKFQENPTEGVIRELIQEKLHTHENLEKMIEETRISRLKYLLKTEFERQKQPQET